MITGYELEQSTIDNLKQINNNRNFTVHYKSKHIGEYKEFDSDYINIIIRGNELINNFKNSLDVLLEKLRIENSQMMKKEMSVYTKYFGEMSIEIEL